MHATMVKTLTETGKVLSQVSRFLEARLLESLFSSVVIEGPDGEREPVTSAQFEVLRYVDRHERPTIKELADGLGTSSAAATKAVNGLADERAVPLVRRSRGSDRRTVRLASTAAGHELVRKVRDALDERLTAVLSRMTDADVDALDQGLRGFLAAALLCREDCDAACLRCGIDHQEGCVVYRRELELTGGGTLRC